jgi:hypothetical protein
VVEIGSIANYKRRYGMLVIYRPQDAVDLTASGGATPSNTSGEIRVEDAASLALTVKHNLAGSNSTNLDVYVYSSEDGVDFDTEPYVSLNVGAQQRKTIPITPGVRFIRVKVENKDTSNATTVTTYVTKWVSY